MNGEYNEGKTTACRKGKHAPQLAGCCCIGKMTQKCLKAQYYVEMTQAKRQYEFCLKKGRTKDCEVGTSKSAWLEVRIGFEQCWIQGSYPYADEGVSFFWWGRSVSP